MVNLQIGSQTKELETNKVEHINQVHHQKVMLLQKIMYLLQKLFVQPKLTQKPSEASVASMAQSGTSFCLLMQLPILVFGLLIMEY